MPINHWENQIEHMRLVGLWMSQKFSGGILHTKGLRMLKEKKAICYPFAFVLYNTKPIAHQVESL